jgi:hypothetical protein
LETAIFGAKRETAMPLLRIETNVNLDTANAEALAARASRAVAPTKVASPFPFFSLSREPPVASLSATDYASLVKY